MTAAVYTLLAAAISGKAADDYVLTRNDGKRIMKVGGWRTRSVSERYNIVDQADVREAMHKLERAQSEFGA